MEPLEFIARYPEYLATIRKMTREEYLPVLEEMEKWEPHDLVKPDTWFIDESAARVCLSGVYIGNQAN